MSGEIFIPDISDQLKVVAIGGGAPNKSASALLKYALEMTGVEHQPQVLVIPTAKRKQETHDQTIASCTDLFIDQLGLPTDVLHAFENLPSDEELEEKIKSADLVYTAGGDTDYMMSIWREHNIDGHLRERALGGLVLSGISAGAIAPFEWGHSDSLSYRVSENEPWDYISVNGLNLVGAAITPHYNTTPQDKPRSQMFHQMLIESQYQRPAFGIDNFAALVVRDGDLASFTTKKDATSHYLHLTDDNQIHKETLKSEYISN